MPPTYTLSFQETHERKLTMFSQPFQLKDHNVTAWCIFRRWLTASRNHGNKHCSYENRTLQQSACHSQWSHGMGTRSLLARPCRSGHGQVHLFPWCVLGIALLCWIQGSKCFVTTKFGEQLIFFGQRVLPAARAADGVRAKPACRARKAAVAKAADAAEETGKPKKKRAGHPANKY